MRRNLPSQDDYNRLIDRYIEARGAERDSIHALIEQEFSVEATLLVLDMSGFSRLTARHGVIHYLAMVRRMHLLTQAIIGNHGGHILKFEADNLFASFPAIDPALQFALDMRAGLDGMNVLTDDASDIHVSIGVASGPALMIEGRDAWGDAMNFASRLGEDIGARGEILVCAKSFAASARTAAYAHEPREVDDKGAARPVVAITGRRL